MDTRESIWTKDMKLDACKMRIDGASYAEIGRKYGVTRERVRQILDAVISAGIHKRKKSIYPFINSWMLGHGVSYTKLAAAMGYANVPGNVSRVSGLLQGRIELKKHEIDNLISVIGEPYEMIFKEEEA